MKDYFKIVYKHNEVLFFKRKGKKSLSLRKMHKRSIMIQFIGDEMDE